MRLGSVSVMFLALLATVACGGRGLSGGPASSNNNPAPPAGSAPPPGGGEVNPRTTVSVVTGSDTSGVNITVPPPAGSENALVLGTQAQGFASNTGAIVHRNRTVTVILFGPGLSGNLTVMVSGPNDIGVSNIRSIQAKDGTAGVAFDAVIGGTSALGARTVYLKATNNDITAFTGGLEVVQ